MLNMKGSKVLLPIFLLAIAVPASTQRTQEEARVKTEAQAVAQREAKTRREINTQLNMIAKEMAQNLSNRGFRGLLQSEIAKSKKREKTLEFRDFLGKATARRDAPPGLQKLRDRVQKTRERIKAARFWHLEGLDIYFPVEEHRNKWKGDDDLLVAFSPVTDEQDVAEIIAYSVKNGKRVVLPFEVPPETPVLMIAPEEHETHEAKPPVPPTDEGAVEGPKPPGGAGSSNSYFGVKYLRIDNDQEPWWKGAPEIYSYYIQRGPTSCQVKYKDLYWVNKERSWYYVWPYVARYFDSRYSNYSYIRFYERDGGTNRAYAFSIDGQTCIYYKKDGDDYIATRWRRKSVYGFNWDYYQDWGRAAVILRKTH